MSLLNIVGSSRCFIPFVCRPEFKRDQRQQQKRHWGIVSVDTKRQAVPQHLCHCQWHLVPLFQFCVYSYPSRAWSSPGVGEF